LTIDGPQRRSDGIAQRFVPTRAVRGERGAALVEAAIILPLVFLLLFGLIAFGRGYNAKVTATHAAREGVRVLAISGDATAAETAARDAASSLDATLLSVSTTACNAGDPTSLTVDYVFNYSIPIFGSRTANISETGVMRCGG